MRVPLVPRPAMKWVSSGQSRQISGPVPLMCAPGLAGLPYWNRKAYSGDSLASRSAIRTAPFDPSSPGERMISAPKISSSCRRSIDTFSGSTMRSL